MLFEKGDEKLAKPLIELGKRRKLSPLNFLIFTENLSRNTDAFFI